MSAATKPACGRIHLGPVAYGSLRCKCCDKIMTPQERVEFWRVRVEVKRMIRDALERFARSKKTK
jgi:hypothetical protein